MAQGASRPLDFELDFHNRPHPYKINKELEVPKLIQAERSRYNECLIQANNNSSLAYYLFKNNDLSRSSRNSEKDAIWNLFKNMEVLTLKSLKEYFITKLNACREYLSLKYE